MKNKTVSIVCGVLVFMALICVIYLIIVGAKSNKNNNVPVSEEPVENELQENVTREERGQNVTVNSRIALQLKEQIKYSEVYANIITNELDEYGLTSNAKLLIALDKIYRKPEYQSYMEYSENYNSTYILPSNMNRVLTSTFTNPNVENKEIVDILSYDTATNAYIILPRGFASGKMEYTIEVPYKITEYSDRIELIAYRVYATKNVEMKVLDTTTNIDFFADKAKSIKLNTITDDTSFTNDTQVDYLKKMIDENTLRTSNLESVKYTFSKEDNNYKISAFENVKNINEIVTDEK